MKNQTEVSYWKANFSPRLPMIHIEAMNKCPVTNTESVNYNLITSWSRVKSVAISRSSASKLCQFSASLQFRQHEMKFN